MRGFVGRHRFGLTLLAIVVVTIVVKTFVIAPFSIPSGSMEKTLEPNDRVLVNQMVYKTRDIKRGEVVVFDGRGSWDPNTGTSLPSRIGQFFGSLVGIGPDTTYIKRVIGLPGDKVSCCTAKGNIEVNGVEVDESSFVYEDDHQQFEVTVPAGRLWVMGDHRGNSYDSREHMKEGAPELGTIPINKVIGQAFWRVWPPSRLGTLQIPSSLAKVGEKSAALATSPAGFAMAVGIPLLVWSRRRRSR